ncbi:MAG: hypothetical protein OXC31_21020 [Spirochaetaceae bacterium]|nr:hypothetical protein [Spirochaetaceae bacterium]
MTRPVRTALHAAYVLVIPVALLSVFAGGFLSLAEIEEYDGVRELTVYGSPITGLFIGAAAGPVVLLAYLTYWLVRHLSGGGKRSGRRR